MDPELKDFLAKNNIPYKLHEHPAVFTVEQSSKVEEIKKIPGVRTKNLFLKDEKGKFYLVVMVGEKRLNVRNMEKNLKVKHLQFGSAQDLKKEMNLTPGSVSIFGMIYAKGTRLLIDRYVWQAEIIGSHPNINTATLELTHSALEKFLAAIKCAYEVIDIE